MISETIRQSQQCRLYAWLVLLSHPALSTHLSHGLMVMTHGFCKSYKQLSDAESRELLNFLPLISSPESFHSLPPFHHSLIHSSIHLSPPHLCQDSFRIISVPEIVELSD